MREAQDKVEGLTGNRPIRAIMNRVTFRHVAANAKVKGAVLAQNITANIIMTDELVKSVFKSLLGITIIVYDQQFRDEEKVAHKFFEDGFCTLIPEGALGSTWFGYTPEERTLSGSSEAKVSVVGPGIAVAVTITNDPVNTKTTVSEIVLPSFERMEETFAIKAF
jgi:hypothetical protein